MKTEFMTDMNRYSEQENIKPIFASLVGSTSKGIQGLSSDYDTRVLYLEPSGFDKIYIPKEQDEMVLRKRCYPETEMTHEWIPFWELTSFFQFLDCPSFKDDFSVGLYRIVPWTLYSPYTWDPYGIQQKIDHVVRSLYNPLYMTQACITKFENYYSNEFKDYFHKDSLDFKYDETSEMIPVKLYIRALYEIVSIDWMLKYNTFHPVYFKSMGSIIPADVLKILNKFMADLAVSLEHVTKSEKNITNIELITQIAVKKEAVWEDYFTEVQNKLKQRDDIQNFQNNPYRQDKIQEIYDLIHHSMYHEGKIHNRNKGN